MEPSLVITAGTGAMYLMNSVGNFKAMNPANHPAEDAVLGVDDKAKAAFAERVKEQGGVDRWSRVAQNQHENFGPALAVFWAGMFLYVGEDKTVVMYSFLAFLACRILFIICYLFSLSPWRSIVFIFSQIAILAGSYSVFAHAFNNWEDIQHWPVAVNFCVVMMYLMNFIARMKSSDPNNHPAEDKVLGVTEEAKGAYKKMIEETGINRWHRIAENQGEQFPIALAILLSTVYVRGDDISGACVLCYFSFRFMFLVCYLCQLSPWRSIVFALGNLTVVVSACLSIAWMYGDGCGRSSCWDQQMFVASVCNVVMFVIYNFSLVKAINPDDHPAEDSALGINDEAKADFKKRVEEQGGVDRWTRIAVNQVENFPTALWVLWACVYSESLNAQGSFYAQYFCGGYVVVRILFLVCYLRGLSPWRTIMFGLGQLAAISAGVCAIVSGVNRHGLQ